MNDSDDLDKHVNEIYQVLNQNDHAKFYDIYDVADHVGRKESLSALYVFFCNDSGIKQDKKISLFLMKFDVKNGLTWTTCLADNLVALPEIQCLKVDFFYAPVEENFNFSFFRSLCTKSILVM